MKSHSETHQKPQTQKKRIAIQVKVTKILCSAKKQLINIEFGLVYNISFGIELRTLGQVLFLSFVLPHWDCQIRKKKFMKCD